MSPASVPALSAAILIAGTAWVNPFLAPGSREARRGMERYDSGDWVAAVEHFRKAGESDSDPILTYDLGAAAYQGQNYPEAQTAFEAAARAEGIPPGPANYNLGNARYRNGDLPGALEAYRNALRADPTDEDARFNYEWTLKQLTGGAPPDSTEPSPDQGDGQDSEGNQDQNRSSPPDSSSESASSGSESQADQDQQAENRPENPEPGDEPGESSSAEEGTPPAEGDSTAAARAGEATMLSPEEAAQLLNAVTPEERELIQARLKAARRRNAEKDW